MNILFVTHYTGLGGANIAMLNLIRQYKKRNIGTYVIMPEGRKGLREKLEDLEIEYAQIRMPWWVGDGEEGSLMSWKRYLSNFRGALEICPYVRKWRIDIIHTNSTVVAAGLLAARMTRRLHVWHLREDLSNYGWKFCLNDKKVKKWFHDSDRVIVISKACERIYEKYLDLEKTVLIYDGAQIDSPKEVPVLEDGVFHMLYLGGMSLSKGYQHILEALVLLKQRTEKRFRLWMPGCRENGRANKELEEFIEVHRLEEAIEPMEYMDREQLDQFRYGMDLFIMASSKEMFGLVTVEAMLSGVPVVASDTGANPELIRNGENGYLYPYGSAKALAEKIQEIMETEDLGNVIEQARAEAQERFSMQSCAEQTIDIYRGILKNSDMGYRC